MGIQGRRTSQAIIDQIIAMRLRGVSYRKICRELLVSSWTVYIHANRKVLRERRRANEQAARARHQAFCDQLNRRAEEIRRGGEGSGNTGWLAGER